MSKISTLNISTIKRNARRRGPTSSEAWNDTFDELVSDLAGLYDQWNNRLKTLTNTLPDGSVDSLIDAFTDGLDGQTLYVKSDAAVSDTTYYNSTSSRPNTLYEQMVALYAYVDDINTTLSGTIGGQVFSAANVSIADNAGVFSATNVETALLELYNLVDISGTSYLPLSGGIITGQVFMTNLPTADPLVAGQLWNNLGVLTVSAG